jgi:hypothetical protein
MQWIDQDFYLNNYNGTPIMDSTEFNQIANSAERVIDQATQFRLSQNDFTTYALPIQNLIKMAISAQIEYFYELGAWTEAGLKTVQSASIGGFSYSDSQANKDVKSMMRSDVAMSYLGATGLMYAGINVHNAGINGRAGFYGDYDVY